MEWMGLAEMENIISDVKRKEQGIEEYTEIIQSLRRWSRNNLVGMG